MAKQTIINTPADSGLGDSLKVAMDKCNSNFTELYTAVSGATITATSDLTNDGSDGTHPFITAQDLPSSFAMSAVTGLNSALSTINANIASISATTTGHTATIASMQSSITTITSALVAMNSTINTQNGQITAIQSDIADIYNIINNL